MFDALPASKACIDYFRAVVLVWQSAAGLRVQDEASGGNVRDQPLQGRPLLVRDGDVVLLEQAQMVLNLSQEARQGDASEFTMNLKT